MKLEYFSLIDQIVSFDREKRSIQAEALVPTSSTIFEGHFPGRPLMPGVLLIETMAQTSGWLILALKTFAAMPLLAAVKEAKLRSFVEPGTALMINATLQHDGSGYAVTAAQIEVGDRIVCNADLTFRLVPFPNQEFRDNVERVAMSISLPMKAAAND
jgi:3-hydroxyacyl-[acyl-carrier-protein] dehydratase